jgi:hypothetical protein
MDDRRAEGTAKCQGMGALLADANAPRVTVVVGIGIRIGRPLSADRQAADTPTLGSRTTTSTSICYLFWSRFRASGLRRYGAPPREPQAAPSILWHAEDDEFSP